MAALRCGVRVLGPVEVVIDDVVQPLRPMARRLLAVLAASPGRVVRTERILDDIWPESPPPSAAKTLQTHVVHLRRALGPAAIVRRSAGYALDTTMVSLDADALARAVSQAEVATGLGDLPGAAIALEEAATLARGVPFDEFALEPFAVAEVVRLQELGWRATLLRADTAISLGRSAAIVGDLERLLIEQPLHESAWATLVRALVAAGRLGDARRAGDRATIVIERELSAPPGERLRDAITTAAKSAGTPPRRQAIPRALIALERTEIVGRDHELSSIEAFLRAGDEHRNRLVVLTGEPGIGKSRLAAAVVARLAVQYEMVLFGRCDCDLVAPYRPFVEMMCERDAVDFEAVGMHPAGRAALGRHLARPPDVRPARPLSDADVERKHLLGAIVDVVRWCGSGRRLLLVVDDVQWADEASLDLLSALIAPSFDVSLDVVVVARSGTAPWQRVAAEALRHNAALSLPLAGIDRTAIGLLAARRLPTADVAMLASQVERITDGNPLLVTFVLDDLAERQVDIPDSVPQRVSLLVEGRIARLRTETLAVLRAGAVAGTSWSVGLLAAVLGWSVDAVHRGVAEAETHELLVHDRDAPLAVHAPNVWFVHDLFRHAIYEATPLDQRTETHARLAALLAPNREAIDAVAFHWQKAGRSVEAARALLSKARRDQSVLLRRAALEAASLALDLIDIDDATTDLAIELEELSAELHLELGDIESARRAVGSAQRMARRQTLAYVRVARAAARIASHDHQWDESGHHLRHALHEIAYLGGLGASIEVDREWCQTQIALGWLRYFNPPSDERTEPEVAMAMREIGDRGTTAQRVEHSHLMAALINRDSRFRSPDAALQLAQRSLLAARELNDPIVVAAKTFSVGFHLFCQGRLDEAEERLAGSAALFADTGAVASAVPALVYRAVVARLRGDPAAAERRALIAMEAATEADAPTYTAAALANLAWVALRRDDRKLAQFQADTALAVWSEPEHRAYPFQGLAAWPALSLALEAHNEAAARELAQRLCAGLQQYLPAAITQDLLGGRFDRPLEWALVRNLA